MSEDTVSKGMVVVGRVVGPRGTKGEVQVKAISDFPGRFSAGGFLYLNGLRYQIERSYMLSNERVTLKLEGIDNPEEAGRLRDGVLMVPEEMVPALPEGEFYHYQIIDVHVYTQDREYLGQVTQILSTGSNDVYVVSSDGKDLLIPAVDEVIKEVDVEKGVMTVDLPEGLRSGS